MTTRSQNVFGHVLDTARWRPHRQAIGLTVLGVFVAIIIGALYLSQAASTATLGRQLEELIVLRNDLEQQNEQIRAEIAGYQSVPRLLTRATELGFAPAEADDIDYVIVDGLNPNRPETVAPLQAEADPLPVYDESFLGWLQQQIDLLGQQLEGFTQQENP